MQSPEPDECQHLLDPRPHRLARHIGLFVQPIADVLRDRERIEQRVVLKQHADVGPHLQQIALPHVVDALAVDEDPARVRPQQSKNELEQHGLAGAARAQQDPHGPLRHAETDVAKDHVFVERQRHVLEDDGCRRRYRGVAVGRRALPLLGGGDEEHLVRSHFRATIVPPPKAATTH